MHDISAKGADGLLRREHELQTGGKPTKYPRIAALSAVWGLRDRRVAWTTQFSPADVAKSFVRDLRRVIRAEWARASSDVTRIPGTHSSWFPAASGRQAARFDVASFEAKWCANDVLASVGRAPGGQPTVRLRLQAPPSGDLA